MRACFSWIPAMESWPLMTSSLQPSGAIYLPGPRLCLLFIQALLACLGHRLASCQRQEGAQQGKSNAQGGKNSRLLA